MWVPLLALFNLLTFVAIRGRWGRSFWALAVAAGVGVVAGDWLGEQLDFNMLRVGDMHVLAACLAAQLLMLAVALLGALGPIQIEDDRK